MAGNFSEAHSTGRRAACCDVQETDREQRPRPIFVQWGDFEFGQKVDAFFAFFVLNNTLMSVHRRFNLNLPSVARSPNRYNSTIILTAYEKRSGGTLHALEECTLCIGEDPRVVSDGARAYVLCRGGWTENEREPEIYKLVLLPERTETKITLPSGLAVGKNWQPFLKDNHLFAVQSFAPLRILQIPETGQAEITHQLRTNFWIPACHDGYTIVRGGSNGMTTRESVTGFGHLTVQRHDHRPFLWTLDASMRPNFIVPSCFLGLREKGFNIVDPTSLFVFKEHIHLGVCASERDWFYGQRFLNLLVELPFGDVASLVRLADNPLFTDLGQYELAKLASTRTFIPADMPHQVQADMCDDGVRSRGEAGYLIHGPYEPIESDATFVATLAYRSFEESTPAVGRFDVCAFQDGATEVLAECLLLGTQSRIKTANLTFSTSDHIGKLLETRVFVQGEVKLEVISLRITECLSSSLGTASGID